jgi:hypothetical protein
MKIANGAARKGALDSCSIREKGSLSFGRGELTQHGWEKKLRLWRVEPCQRARCLPAVTNASLGVSPATRTPMFGADDPQSLTAHEADYRVYERDGVVPGRPSTRVPQ